MKETGLIHWGTSSSCRRQVSRQLWGVVRKVQNEGSPSWVDVGGRSRWRERVNVELTLEVREREWSEQEEGWVDIPTCGNSRYTSQKAGKGMAGSRSPETSLGSRHGVPVV